MDTLKHVQILTDACRLESQYAELWTLRYYMILFLYNSCSGKIHFLHISISPGCMCVFTDIRRVVRSHKLLCGCWQSNTDALQRQ